jgi:hypothetical protein
MFALFDLLAIAYNIAASFVYFAFDNGWGNVVECFANLFGRIPVGFFALLMSLVLLLLGG